MNGLATELVHVAREVMAKERPQTLFEGVFHDLREKAKAMKSEWEKQAAIDLENKVVADLRAAGVEVQEAKLSLGRYRGSSFVTSFKLKVVVSGEMDAQKLVEYLRGKYSPKWRVKGVTGNIAELNVR